MKFLFFVALFLYWGHYSYSQLKNKHTFEGSLMYTSLQQNGKVDTNIIFIQKNKILAIWNAETFKRKGATRRLILVNDDSTIEYKFQDKKKVILKGIPNNEFAQRNFILLNQQDTVAGFSCVNYYSSFTTNNNPANVTNTYKKEIFVSPELKFRDMDTYLVNFFVYKGNIITQVVDTFYFAHTAAPYVVKGTLIKINYNKPDDKLFELPQDYVIQPFSDKLFRKLFMEPDEEEIEEAVKEVQRRKNQKYIIPPDFLSSLK